MPTIDQRGALHDRLGRYTDQHRSTAGYDLAGVGGDPLVESGLFARIPVADLRPGQTNAFGQTVAAVEQVTGTSVKVTYTTGDTAYYGDPSVPIVVQTAAPAPVPADEGCEHGRAVPDCRCATARACAACIAAGCVDIPHSIHDPEPAQSCLCCGAATWAGTVCPACHTDLDRHLRADDAPGTRRRAIEAVRALRDQERSDPYGRDTLVIDGTRFTRARDGVWPETPYQTRIEADRDLTDDEAARLAQLFGYAYATTGGERAGDPTDRDTPRSLIFATDTTKNRAYERLDRFTALLTDPEFVGGGSPVRKTDRAGAGTKGTRLIDGLGPNPPHLAVYYDSVWQ